jgi:hypothetical protein
MLDLEELISLSRMDMALLHNPFIVLDCQFLSDILFSLIKRLNNLHLSASALLSHLVVLTLSPNIASISSNVFPLVSGYKK